MSTTYHFQTPFQNLEHSAGGEHDAHWIADANCNGICRINHDDRIDPESTHRVVALFTAAPELLTACKKAKAWITSVPRDKGAAHEESRNDVWQTLQDAIAAASPERSPATRTDHQMTPAVIEEWRHWNTSSEIADVVRRYVASGESLHDNELITDIQAVLKRTFPLLGAQDNGLSFEPTRPPATA